MSDKKEKKSESPETILDDDNQDDDTFKKKDAPKSKKDDTPLSEDKQDDLIGGNGLISMLEDLIPMLMAHSREIGKNEGNGGSGGGLGGMMVGNPFDVIGDGDMDDDDSVVNTFKNDIGGSKAIIKVIKKMPGEESAGHIAEIVENLKNVRLSEKKKLFRQAFSEVIAARDNETRGKYQLKATMLIDKLIKSAVTSKERKNLLAAKEAVLSGEDYMIDAASFRLRNSYSSYVEPNRNVRLAYTTLNEQIGEGYMLCPKTEQTGKLTPLEISKARANCIDCVTEPDGKLVCGYARYLERIADSTAKVNARMDVHHHPDNKDTLMTLKPGDRSNPVTYNEKNMEARLEAGKVWTTDSKEYKKMDEKDFSLEKRIRTGLPSLEGSTTPEEARKLLAARSKKVDQLDPRKEETIEEQMDGKRDDYDDFGDETLEEMLKDDQKGLTDDEIDMLLNDWLGKDWDEKTVTSQNNNKQERVIMWYNHAKTVQAQKAPDPSKVKPKKADELVDNPGSRTYKHDGPIGESIDTRNKSKVHTPFHLTNMERLLEPAHMEPTEGYEDTNGMTVDSGKPDEFDLTNKLEQPINPNSGKVQKPKQAK